MKVINDLITEANITLTDMEQRNLTYVIEKMEVDFNSEESVEAVEDFGIHSMYLDRDNDINLVCFDGMQQQGTVIESEELETLGRACTQEELDKITERVKIDVTQ
ncbi:TPA: hypothetical protein OVC47_002340 [Staphylococcus aureus]|nr:hypothetical protein [Staphylococcus aureus]HDA4897135.1 hypothetical protein [Staphylococcus aureus]HEA0121568.1 hypothetical protein [Staphylococcus aureus]